jgi:hypothetical protein
VLSRRYTVRIPSGTPSTRSPRCCPANRRATPSPREEPKHLTRRDVLQTHSAHPRARNSETDGLGRSGGDTNDFMRAGFSSRRSGQSIS